MTEGIGSINAKWARAKKRKKISLKQEIIIYFAIGQFPNAKEN